MQIQERITLVINIRGFGFSIPFLFVCLFWWFGLNHKNIYNAISLILLKNDISGITFVGIFFEFDSFLRFRLFVIFYCSCVL